MSSTSRSGLQCFTLLLVFLMGMFITASMFFTFPTIKGPIGDNFYAAKSTLSSIIGRGTVKESRQSIKESQDKRFPDKGSLGFGALALIEGDTENRDINDNYTKPALEKKIKESKKELGSRDKWEPTKSNTKHENRRHKYEITRRPYTTETIIVSSDKNKSDDGDQTIESKQKEIIRYKLGESYKETQYIQHSSPFSETDQNFKKNNAIKNNDHVNGNGDEVSIGNNENKVKSKGNSSQSEAKGQSDSNDRNRIKNGTPKNEEGGKMFKQDNNREVDDRGYDNRKTDDKTDKSWKSVRSRKKKNDSKSISDEKRLIVEEKENKNIKEERELSGIKRDIPLWDTTDKENLLEIFETKLNQIKSRKSGLDDTCYNKRTISNSCDKDGCLQIKLPPQPEERLHQLTHRPGLTLTDQQHAIIREMASQVTENYDIILLTTASSNHFLESQALLQNLHKYVFPVLKNFALLFYDIGLEPAERIEMEKYCKCKVLPFPFDKLPNYIRNLKCYAWKPLMIKAHIRQANVVLWLDASIRFNGDATQLQQLIKRVRKRGVQIGRSSADSSFRTFRSMYHYFGDEPCMYLGMGQAQATIGGYHSEPFVDRVILEPWVACALNQECMCPITNRSAGCAESKKMAENLLEHNGPIIYGLCHRFDQSAITLILHKLYQSHYRHVMMRVKEYGRIERDNQVEYFKTLYH